MLFFDSYDKIIQNQIDQKDDLNSKREREREVAYSAGVAIAMKEKELETEQPINTALYVICFLSVICLALMGRIENSEEETLGSSQ